MEKVLAPDGRTWLVRRRWIPRLGADTLWNRFFTRMRRTGQRVADGADVADPGCAEFIGEGFVAAIAIVVGILLLLFVVFPLLVAVVDVLILLLLALLGAAARILFRRPWIVEARASDGAVHRWKVVGWRASAERCTEVARRLGAGIPPEGMPP